MNWVPFWPGETSFYCSKQAEVKFIVFVVKMYLDGPNMFVNVAKHRSHNFDIQGGIMYFVKALQERIWMMLLA